MDFALDLPDSRSKRVPLSPKKENIIQSSTSECKANSNQNSNKSLKDTARLVPRLVAVLPGCKDRLESTVSLLTKYKNLDHFAYERKDVWHIGIGSRSSLQVDPRAKTALMTIQGRQEECPIVGSLTDFVRDFIEDQSLRHEGKLFGQVGFNYGAHVREQSYTPGRWPILSMMVPELEIALRPDRVNIQGYDQKQLDEVCDFLKGTSMMTFRAREPQPVNKQVNEKEYKTIVSKALAEITDGKYDKVIVSRAVDLGSFVDMPSTVLFNEPFRVPSNRFQPGTCNGCPEWHRGHRVSILSIFHTSCCGFCAISRHELESGAYADIMTFRPLAGTCSRIGQEEYAEMLTHKLLRDPKEVVEHIISVKEVRVYIQVKTENSGLTFLKAISELNRFCVPDTVCVKDLVSLAILPLPKKI
jgi:salicylate synthetase